MNDITNEINVKYKNHKLYKGTRGGVFFIQKGRKHYIPKSKYENIIKKKNHEVRNKSKIYQISKKIKESKNKDNNDLFDLLNHAYNHIIIKNSSDNNLNIFLKNMDNMDNYILISIIKELSLKGWKTLNSLKLSKEVHCNMLCASIALINFNLIKKKIFNELNILEKLYLAFFEMFTIIKTCNPLKCRELLFDDSFNWCKNKGINDYFKKEIKEKIENISNDKTKKQEFFQSLFTYYKDIIEKKTGKILETKKMSYQIPKANHNLYLLIKSFLDDDTNVEEEIDNFFEKESNKFKEDIFKNDLICIAYFLNDTFKKNQVVNDNDNFSIFIQRYYYKPVQVFCKHSVKILKGLIYLLYDFNYIYNLTDINKYLKSKRISNYTNMTLNLNINIFDYINKLKDNDVLVTDYSGDIYLKDRNRFNIIDNLDKMKKKLYFTIFVASCTEFIKSFYRYRKFKKKIQLYTYNSYNFFLKTLIKSRELEEIFHPDIWRPYSTIHFIVCTKSQILKKKFFN